jgi:transcriptional repressor NrdR
MFCPFCNVNETKVIDSRLVEESNQVRRRRECLQCKERFTTYENAALALPSIIKRDGRRSEFNEDKVRRGLTKALEKRPVSTEKIEEIIAHIKGHLRASGEREVDADQIGLLIMDELSALDQVAYVRFASVYRDFQDVDAFKKEIDKLLVRK